METEESQVINHKDLKAAVLIVIGIIFLSGVVCGKYFCK